MERLNPHGQVAGYRSISRDDSCYSERAYVFDDRSGEFLAIDGGPVDIRADVCFRYSRAMALNGRGEVVGYSTPAHVGDDQDSWPFLWTRATGPQAIPVPDPSMRYLIPTDINDRGQVVGLFQYRDAPLRQPWRYFYWDVATGLVDLQTLLDPADPLTPRVLLKSNGDPIRINARGTISVPGRLTGDGATHWFVLMAQ